MLIILFSKDELNWSKVTACYKRFLFLINANDLLFRESWKKVLYHGFHKCSKRHNCFQHW